ncbi:MAG: ANTAR domain-containing protein [Verrucomicrobiota bacterium]|nr:ANTAR domain-containing protein [Verrucomicrobiota bacterium]
MIEHELKILVIDESTERMQSMREALAQCGYVHVICAFTSEDVLERVYATNPDVILIDVESPTRDTLEQLTLIQQSRPKPVVLFTQDQKVQTIQAAIQSGVSAYVTAGISVSEVQPAIEVAMASFRNFERLREELTAARSDLSEVKLVNRAKGVIMDQRGLTEDQAYHVMRRAAMNRKVKLADLAREVIALSKGKSV